MKAPDIKGLRTFIFGVISLTFLLTGLSMALGKPVSGSLFSDFATAVVGIMLAVAGKSVIAALGQGGGVKGAWTALMTDSKPGQPQQPTPPPATPPGAGKAS